jgi:hypothetical protein
MDNEKGLVLIITETGSSTETWTAKRTSHDHYSDRILDRDMGNEKDESQSGTGSSTGTWTGKRTSHA